MFSSLRAEWGVRFDRMCEPVADRCPHCGADTEVAAEWRILDSNSADGRQWTREELDPEKVLQCLGCGRHFAEKRAAVSSRPPSTTTAI
jgi:hypothetical protein